MTENTPVSQQKARGNCDCSAGRTDQTWTSAPHPRCREITPTPCELPLRGKPECSVPHFHMSQRTQVRQCRRQLSGYPGHRHRHTCDTRCNVRGRLQVAICGYLAQPIVSDLYVTCANDDPGMWPFAHSPSLPKSLVAKTPTSSAFPIAIASTAPCFSDSHNESSATAIGNAHETKHPASIQIDASDIGQFATNHDNRTYIYLSVRCDCPPGRQVCQLLGITARSAARTDSSGVSESPLRLAESCKERLVVSAA